MFEFWTIRFEGGPKPAVLARSSLLPPVALVMTIRECVGARDGDLFGTCVWGYHTDVRVGMRGDDT